MSQMVYSYEDFLNPENNISVGSLKQLEGKTKMDERTLGRKLKVNGIYVDPLGRFKVLRLKHEPNKRVKNGNVKNFIKGDE